MLSALSKPRSSSNLLSIHMKFLLLIVIGVLLWNSDKAREFTSEQLNNASEFIAPDKTNSFTIKF